MGANEKSGHRNSATAQTKNLWNGVPQSKNKHFILKEIVLKVEKGTGLSISELKSKYSEDQIFALGLKYVTTTKKAFCSAMEIPVEAGCRYKRTLEKYGLLVQSTKEVICPYTRHLAHLISTNPDEFQRLTEVDNQQLSLF